MSAKNTQGIVGLSEEENLIENEDLQLLVQKVLGDQNYRLAVRYYYHLLWAMAEKHILVVIFFGNTELEALVTQDTENMQAVYHKTIGEKFVLEKRLMQKEL